MCIGIIYDFPEDDVEVLQDDLKKETIPEIEDIVVIKHDIKLVYVYGAC